MEEGKKHKLSRGAPASRDAFPLAMPEPCSYTDLNPIRWEIPRLCRGQQQFDVFVCFAEGAE